MSNVFPRQNGKSTLALNCIRLQEEVNEANYKTYAERVKNDLLRKENQQLKELLKECLNDVNHIISKVHLCKELLDLKNKIDNAIGEKK